MAPDDVRIADFCCVKTTSSSSCCASRQKTVSVQFIKYKSPGNIAILGTVVKKKAASYSPTLHCSTIGASGLNFSVRNGKRWDPAAITT